MPRRADVSSELHIRIKKTTTLDTIKDLYKKKTHGTVNEIINAALEKGLPIIEENADVAHSGTLAQKVSDGVLEKLSPLTDSLLLNMRKITVLQSVQESMLGSLIQEFEFFLKTKGIAIDPKLLDEFRFNIPERFDADKQELIDRLFTDDQETDDDE